MERGHQLGGEHRPHHLADRTVRGDDPDDPEPVRQMRRDRGLPDPGRAADQDHERHVQPLDVLPSREVRRVPIARELPDDVQGEP